MTPSFTHTIVVRSLFLDKERRREEEGGRRKEEGGRREEWPGACSFQ